MIDTQLFTKQVLQQELDNNQNPLGFKICIAEVMKGVEDRVHWYFTADQAEFLTNVYTNEVDEQVLRKRLKQITDDALNQVCLEIETGKLIKKAVQKQQLVTTMRILQKVQRIATSGYDYYSPNHPSARENIEKIRAINEDYRTFKEKINNIKQHERQKKLQKQQIEKEIQQKIAEERKLSYHKQVMKRLEIIKIKQEQRIEQNQKFKLFLKEYKKSKPLHLLMEMEYKEKIQLPQLQQSKKKLQLYKHKKKPTLEEINNHQNAYMTFKQSKPEKNFIKNHTIDVGYKSEFYKKIEEDEKNGLDDEYSSTLWDQMEKKKRYSLMVKEKFKPKTSRLHQNLSIDISQQRKSQAKIVPDLSRVRQIGKFYLEYVRNLQKNRQSLSTQKKQEMNEKQKVPHSRYTNYLEEFKRTHEGKYRGVGADWQIDLNDRTASKSEKRDRILIKTKQLQEKAFRDQIFVKNFNYGKAEQIIGKKKEIDETLLEAIRAKVALLKEVKND